MILAICYGNPLRGDDGLGWEIARRLAGKTLPAHARIDVYHQLTPELAEPISHAERVVFVDARTGGEPGEITCTPIRPAEDRRTPVGHALGPEGLLALSRELYGKVPEAVMCSVAGTHFGLGETFSREVEQALPDAAARIWACLTNEPRGCQGALSMAFQKNAGHAAKWLPPGADPPASLP